MKIDGAGQSNDLKSFRFPYKWENTTPQGKHNGKNIRFPSAPNYKEVVSSKMAHRTTLDKSPCACSKNKDGKVEFNYRSKIMSGCIENPSGDDYLCAENFCCPTIRLTSNNINSIARNVSGFQGKRLTGLYYKNDTREKHYTHQLGTFHLCVNERGQWQVSSVNSE